MDKDQHPNDDEEYLIEEPIEDCFIPYEEYLIEEPLPFSPFDLPSPTANPNDKEDLRKLIMELLEEEREKCKDLVCKDYSNLNLEEQREMKRSWHDLDREVRNLEIHQITNKDLMGLLHRAMNLHMALEKNIERNQWRYRLNTVGLTKNKMDELVKFLELILASRQGIDILDSYEFKVIYELNSLLPFLRNQKKKGSRTKKRWQDNPNNLYKARTLRYNGGLTDKEIAEYLGVSISTVKRAIGGRRNPK